MTSYTLEIEAFGIYSTDVPILEVWSEGVLDSSYSIVSSGSIISLTISYSGSLPSSLSFCFNDALAETGRSIQIQSVKINENYVNTGNFLSTNNLLIGESAVVDVPSASFIFDDSEPDPSVFSPTSVTLTTNNDNYNNQTGVDLIIDGLAGRDSIRVGSGDDKINGNDGDDIIRAGAGNDLVYGAEGVDRLYGDVGDDIIYGGNGNDFLYGEDGDDQLHGGDGNDKLIGNDGNDTITGGNGDDNIFSGFGNDIIFAGSGDDIVVADSGDDTIDGGAGDDYLQGNAGYDQINGGDGDDLIYGQGDDDILDGGDGNNTVSGGLGNDVLYGGTGYNLLQGDEGSDVIYSRSNQTIDALVSDILANNSGVVYNEDTNSFYKYISAGITWSNATIAANAATLTGLSGVNGHVVTITTAVENSYVANLASSNGTWLGANDAVTEGKWLWTTGPETGQQFWSGGFFGSGVNSLYSNWFLLNPTGSDDYASLDGLGLWTSDTGTSTGQGYVIEWEADSLLSAVDQTVILPGADADTIYNSLGIDVIKFDVADAVDDIFNFDTLGRDVLDISDIISYDPLTDDLTDFVKFTTPAFSSDTTLAVDVDGTANGINFINIAVLHDVTGLDLALLVAGDNLVVA